MKTYILPCRDYMMHNITLMIGKVVAMLASALIWALFRGIFWEAFSLLAEWEKLVLPFLASLPPLALVVGKHSRPTFLLVATPSGFVVGTLLYHFLFVTDASYASLLGHLTDVAQWTWIVLASFVIMVASGVLIPRPKMGQMRQRQPQRSNSPTATQRIDAKASEQKAEQRHTKAQVKAGSSTKSGQKASETVQAEQKEAAKAPSNNQPKRYEDIHSVMEALSKSDVTEFKPIPDRTAFYGGRYPDVEKVFSVEEDKVQGLLNYLEKVGLVDREGREFKVITCPYCGSSLYNVDLTCRSCGSTDIKSLSSITHPACGYIGDTSEFKRDNRYACPRCNIDITDALISGEITRFSFFHCNACGDTMIEPKTRFLCLTCGRNYSAEEADFRYFVRYSIRSDLVSSWINVERFIQGVKDSLSKVGVQIEEYAPERSGVDSHAISNRGRDIKLMVIKKDGRPAIALAHLYVGANESMDVIPLFNNLLELKKGLNVEHLLIFTGKALGEEVKRFAQSLSMTILDSNATSKTTPEEVASSIVRLLHRTSS